MQRSIVVVVTTAALLSASSLAAQQQPRNALRERRIEEGLASVAPAAVPTFRRATEAMDAGRHADAEPLFREVLAAAPTFTPALRRLGGVLVERGLEGAGLDLLKQAVQLERSPENLVSLATALAYRPGGKMGSLDDQQTALGLAKEAAATNPHQDDASYTTVVAQLALSVDDTKSFRGAVTVLRSNHPGTLATHYFSAIAAAMDKRWEDAENEIREAERLGLPKEAVDSFLATGVHSNANVWRYARYTAYLFGVWATGLVVLFVAGRLLSSRMLLSIEQADPNVLASDAERSLRRIYRTVINCAGAYYYVSLPFVLVLVLGGAAALVYGFLMLGRVPIKLVAILVIAALVTAFKMLQSLFIKVAADDPGRALEESEAPALWALAREVAESVGTRAVDEIRVTPGTDMAVYERGTAADRRRDVARRILILGVGLLNGFHQGAFRAVLAHEYGHFAHRDTAGGRSRCAYVATSRCLRLRSMSRVKPSPGTSRSNSCVCTNFCSAESVTEPLACKKCWPTGWRPTSMARQHSKKASGTSSRAVSSSKPPFTWSSKPLHKPGAACTTCMRYRPYRNWPPWTLRTESRMPSRVQRRRTIHTLARPIDFAWCSASSSRADRRTRRPSGISSPRVTN